MTLRCSIIDRLGNGTDLSTSATPFPPIDDFDLNPGVSTHLHPRPSAVLVPLIDRAEGMSVLLTQRTDHLNAHAGQVSFPGGRVEPGDRDCIDTALRETEEEIGLDREHIEVITLLDTYDTMTGFRITPVVGIVRPGFVLELDPFEVADAFEIPIDLALDAARYQRKSRVYQGSRRQFYVLDHDERYIWGATAGILFNLCRRLEGIIDLAQETTPQAL
jgi:8-oxo-dGTP pyrophosphatase MutT (NUDIX family)